MAFCNIRNCMLERDVEFIPFYLFIRQFVCILKISSKNSVIKPFKVLPFQLLAFGYLGGE